MDRPSNTFSKAGFYLVLLAAFFISIYAELAFFVAVIAFVLWVLEQAIFRNTDWTGDPMFYPICAFIIFTALSTIISGLTSDTTIMAYTGYAAAFYFVSRRFVSLSEKRKMVIWTFMAGVVLSSAFNLISGFSEYGFINFSAIPISATLSFFVMVVFAFILSFYSEARSPGEKLFFGFVLLPLAAVVLYSFDELSLVIMLILSLILGILKDRTVFIPLGIFLIVLSALAFIISEAPVELRITEKLAEHTRELTTFNEITAKTGFFGLDVQTGDPVLIGGYVDSFYFRFLAASGPPALLLFLWILGEQTKRNFTKFRKVHLREMRIFHLGMVLSAAAIFLLNIFGSTFDSGASTLFFWMILGMSEI